MIQSENSSIPKHELKKSLKTEEISNIANRLDEFKNQYSLQLID